tara:strand:+ start:1323 stop:1724 length:402 start_codon:yes stop_codon:yes gene_type:complete
MIRLEQDTINKVIVTLREFTTISNPFYLFEFISDDTNEPKIFTGTDISTNVNRYNEFNIQLTTSTEDLLNSIVKLPLKGFYKYNIYSQVSSTNLDLANITELVEVGKVYVDGTIKPDLTIYGSGTDNKIVYNG